MLDSKYNIGIIHTLNSLTALDPDELKKFRNQGLKVLSIMIKKAVTQFPDTTFYGFSVSGKTMDKQFEEIFINTGALYFSRFSDDVAKTEGTNCAPLDGHWNHLGNKLAGELLSELITGH